MVTLPPVLGQKVKVATWSELADRKPHYALVANVDLVIIRYDDNVSVLHGRCHHRGALLADGSIQGQNLICGVHGWDYRYDTGVSEYNNSEALNKFGAWIEKDGVFVDPSEIRKWEEAHPQPFHRDDYQGTYADIHGTIEEPRTQYIHELAKHGLKKQGHHGAVSAMGIPAPDLPRWDDIQILTAQLARLPHLEETEVGTDVVIGPRARKPSIDSTRSLESGHSK